MSDVEATDPVAQETEARRRRNRIIRHRAELFQEAAKTEAFRALLEELGRKAERVREEATVNALSPEGANQRNLDYGRGFLAGMDYIRLVVTASENTLQKLDAEAEAAGQSEPDDERSNW